LRRRNLELEAVEIDLHRTVTDPRDPDDRIALGK